MITLKDMEKVREILTDSKLWKSIEKIEDLGEQKQDSDTRFDNIIQVTVGERTSISGGKDCQMSIEATIPLMKEQFIVVFCTLEHIWIKKIKPILRWDLVEC